jgi:hypothetical protein
MTNFENGRLVMSTSFCHGKTLSDQCRYFLDGFSRLSVVLNKMQYVQNRLDMSFLGKFLQILHNVCSRNGNVKCLSTPFLKKNEIVFHLAAMSQGGLGGGEGHIKSAAIVRVRVNKVANSKLC